ncbi:D-glycerate dehydrogenase [Defluviimonas sp. WL0002]|uniref:D-glycerate dehydrogenase n=1 Tax=Albidovulum marisflavi TaxID=2984159 RepID=A0ABT2ZEN0_9RHOB|nr:D-glycerate dehydrogenase [Defluviimonas sp. WL0002]MCV2869554.1 D-glycerate dehydrogenase [Defluviimonas sp. WL0002]
MKLFVSRPLPDAVLKRARAHFDMTYRTETRPMSQDECVAALEGYDIVLPTLGDIYRAETFAAAKGGRCKLLANFGVGYNHIDVAAARSAGIAVTNTPGAVTDATADIAMMLILMSARRAAEGERLVRSGQWEGWHPTQMLGLHVTGKTVAIIGMGRIGKAIARRCHHGFGMEVVFFNRSPVADAGVPARQLPTLEAAMAAADVVVIAVPGGAETRHLIGKGAIAAMQPHAHLVNIARGDVVEEAALIAALQSNRIGGAGLDVYEREPQVPEELIRLDNVTLLPHLGTAALEVRTAMGMMALDNAIAFAEGRDLTNPV